MKQQRNDTSWRDRQAAAWVGPAWLPRERAWMRALRVYKLRQMGLSYSFIGALLGVSPLRATQLAEQGQWVALHGNQGRGVREGFFDVSSAW